MNPIRHKIPDSSARKPESRVRVFFGEKPFVLRLQVDAPLDREFELLVALEHLVRLVLIHMYEFRADDPLEFANQPVLDALVEEGEIFLPLVQ